MLSFLYVSLDSSKKQPYCWGFTSMVPTTSSSVTSLSITAKLILLGMVSRMKVNFSFHLGQRPPSSITLDFCSTPPMRHTKNGSILPSVSVSRSSSASLAQISSLPCAVLSQTTEILTVAATSSVILPSAFSTQTQRTLIRWFFLGRSYSLAMGILKQAWRVSVWGFSCRVSSRWLVRGNSWQWGPRVGDWWGAERVWAQVASSEARVRLQSRVLKYSDSTSRTATMRMPLDMIRFIMVVAFTRWNKINGRVGSERTTRVFLNKCLILG